jgi:hypothetical protein
MPKVGFLIEANMLHVPGGPGTLPGMTRRDVGEVLAENARELATIEPAREQNHRNHPAGAAG